MRRETGRKYAVQVRCSEGGAIHTDPESCALHREMQGEALTGDDVGQPLSGERLHNRSVDAFQSAEDNTGRHDIASAGWLRAVWRTWHVRTSAVGNREVSILRMARRAVRTTISNVSTDPA